jgi:flagellar biosynthetic protein FliO
MPGTVTDILTVIFAILALAAVLLLAYFTTRWLGRRIGGGHGTGNIEIIERQFLGQDKSLMIIRAGSKTMLLGITSGRISKLCDIDPSELTGGAPVRQGDFASVIRRVLESRKSKDPYGDSAGNGGEGPKGGHAS